MKHFFVALLNFCVNLLRLGGTSLAAEERGAGKPRGRGLGQAQQKSIACFNGVLLISLAFLCALTATSCVNTYEEKEQFTKKNIQSVNDKNAKKHGELIVPTLAKQYNK